MRQLKITKPLPEENFPPEEIRERQERFCRIINQLRGGNILNEKELRMDLSVYLSEFCEKFHKFKPTEAELSELISYCLKFSKEYDIKRFDKWFFVCLRQIVSLYL